MALTSFVVDQAASFKAAHFIQSDPKPAFGGAEGQQEKTRDGVPVWIAQVMLTADQFGRPVNEVAKVTIVSPKDPAEGVPPFAPVKLHGLTVNVYDASRKNRDTNAREVTGAGVSLRCERIESDMRQMKAAS